MRFWDKKRQSVGGEPVTLISLLRQRGLAASIELSLTETRHTASLNRKDPTLVHPYGGFRTRVNRFVQTIPKILWPRTLALRTLPS
ncbi:hypothetical protein RRG08_033188 [Elysia crispata]|uniref:Uncharacterized protein n=1 Tax=Elysia crispata TaxID=231223 RepID=A0AAE1ECG9_9GAST|nr:hypothetical protein RRG08_033188 [Elysia crispata]